MDLPEPELADHADNFAGVDIEAHAPDDLDVALQRDPEPLHFKKMLRRHRYSSFGSRRSRSELPMKLQASPMERMARPGPKAIHHE